MDIVEMLQKNSTKQYHIEYNGYLFNHISHGIIALYKLGADEQTIQIFIDNYKPRLEEATKHSEQFPQQNVQVDLESIKGQRVLFYPLYDHYAKLLTATCHGSLEEFIRGYFVGFIDAIGCSLLHALIHLGYGYSVKSERMVVEAMAYFHHSNIPMVFNNQTQLQLGNGKEDIFDVLEDLRKDAELLQFMYQESSSKDWLVGRGEAQKRLMILLNKRGDRLAEYVSRIKLPGFFNAAVPTLDGLRNLMDWVLDCTVMVYLCVECTNDFILLHGITSAWSTRIILDAFNESTQNHALRLVRNFLVMLLATYVSKDAPAMKQENLDLKCDKTWEELIKESFSADRDEHVYKLVQVCYERSQSNTSGLNGDIYKCAAQICINHPFFNM